MPEPIVRADIKAGRLVRLNLRDWRGGEYVMQAVYKIDSPLGPAGQWLIERLVTLSDTPEATTSDQATRRTSAKARRRPPRRESLFTDKVSGKHQQGITARAVSTHFGAYKSILLKFLGEARSSRPRETRRSEFDHRAARHRLTTGLHLAIPHHLCFCCLQVFSPLRLVPSVRAWTAKTFSALRGSISGIAS